MIHCPCMGMMQGGSLEKLTNDKTNCRETKISVVGTHSCPKQGVDVGWGRVGIDQFLPDEGGPYPAKYAGWSLQNQKVMGTYPPFKALCCILGARCI